jgi:hypothetical protein
MLVRLERIKIASILLLNYMTRCNMSTSSTKTSKMATHLNILMETSSYLSLQRNRTYTIDRKVYWRAEDAVMSVDWTGLDQGGDPDPTA